jgi:two-component system chemotaxis response regulator CheY
MKLLIVDDSSIMRRTIEKYLTNYPLEIIGMAGNGVEALEMVKEKKPDAVTLDITMPEMDGLTCLENIMEIAPDTNVIVITALSDKMTGLQALKKGAAAYLFKPVSEEDIREAFDDLLNEVNS